MNENNKEINLNKIKLISSGKKSKDKDFSVSSIENVPSKLNFNKSNDESIIPSIVADSSLVQTDNEIITVHPVINKKHTHFKTISKNNINFLIEYDVTDNNESASMFSFQNKNIHISNINDTYLPNTTTQSNKIDRVNNSKSSINFDIYNNNPAFLLFLKQFLSSMITFNSDLLNGKNEISSYHLISEWFECSKKEHYYNIEQNIIYKEETCRIIIKEFFILELIGINLHLLVLNKVIDFPLNFIERFFSLLKELFLKFYDNFIILCALGLSEEILDVLFSKDNIKPLKFNDIILVNSNNKEIRKLIGKMTKLIKDYLTLNDNEIYCYKHLKSIYKCFYNEFYHDLKEYSYSVYLFNDSFLETNNNLEQTYSISNIINTRDEQLNSPCKIKYPFLESKLSNKEYTLVLDLDETLIHCISVRLIN